MTRINDVGGMEGFGPVYVTGEDPAFEADWEARVFALNTALLRAGVYALDEFRDAVERMPAVEYLEASYYRRWLSAIQMLLVEKGVVAADDLVTAEDAPS